MFISGKFDIVCLFEIYIFSFYSECEYGFWIRHPRIICNANMMRDEDDILGVLPKHMTIKLT